MLSAVMARASCVRDAVGAVPRGDFANHAWGVVDMLAELTSQTSG